MIELKKYREVMFDGTEDSGKIAKFEEKLICASQNEEFSKYSAEHLKVSKLRL